MKDRPASEEIEEGNRAQLCVLRDASFGTEFRSRMIKRDEVSGRSVCVCSLVFIIPLHAARRAMAAAGFLYMAISYLRPN